jgi:hypothetical protein
LHRARGRMAKFLGVEPDPHPAAAPGQSKRETTSTGGPGDA